MAITDSTSSISNSSFNRNNWMILIKMFQYLYYANLRREEILISDFKNRYPKHKKIAEKVWECFHDLKIEWPHEMYHRVF